MTLGLTREKTQLEFSKSWHQNKASFKHMLSDRIYKGQVPVMRLDTWKWHLISMVDKQEDLQQSPENRGSWVYGKWRQQCFRIQRSCTRTFSCLHLHSQAGNPVFQEGSTAWSWEEALRAPWKARGRQSRQRQCGRKMALGRFQSNHSLHC